MLRSSPVPDSAAGPGQCPARPVEFDQAVPVLFEQPLPALLPTPGCLPPVSANLPTANNNNSDCS